MNALTQPRSMFIAQLSIALRNSHRRVKTTKARLVTRETTVRSEIAISTSRSQNTVQNLWPLQKLMIKVNDSSGHWIFRIFVQ